MTISKQNINMNWTSMNIYNFVDQLNDENHENWYLTNIDTTTVKILLTSEPTPTAYTWTPWLWSSCASCFVAAGSADCPSVITITIFVAFVRAPCCGVKLFSRTNLRPNDVLVPPFWKKTKLCYIFLINNCFTYQ